MYLEARLVPDYERSVSASAARDKMASPVIHEGRLHRDWAERREDEHQQVESHHRGGDNASTVQNAHICSSPMPSSHESMAAGSHIQVAQTS
jgi:hypothetical protein